MGPGDVNVFAIRYGNFAYHLGDDGDGREAPELRSAWGARNAHQRVLFENAQIAAVASFRTTSRDALASSTTTSRSVVVSRR